jgi:hypothetical protein
VENEAHNLVGPLLADTSYVEKYKASFPRPTSRTGVYSSTLDKSDNDFIRAKGEATHMAKQENWVL